MLTGKARGVYVAWLADTGEKTENAQACSQSLTTDSSPNTFVIPDDLTNNPCYDKRKAETAD